MDNSGQYAYIGASSVGVDPQLYCFKGSTRRKELYSTDYYITKIPYVDEYFSKLCWKDNIKAANTLETEEGLIRTERRGLVESTEKTIPIRATLQIPIDVTLLHKEERECIKTVSSSCAKTIKQDFSLYFNLPSPTVIQLPSTLESVAKALGYLRQCKISMDSSGKPNLAYLPSHSSSDLVSMHSPSTFNSSSSTCGTPQNCLPPLEFPFKDKIQKITWTSFDLYKISIYKNAENTVTTKLTGLKQGKSLRWKSTQNVTNAPLADYHCVWKGPTYPKKDEEIRLFMNFDDNTFLCVGIELKETEKPSLQISSGPFPPSKRSLQSYKAVQNWKEAKKTENNTSNSLEGLNQIISTNYYPERTVEIIKVLAQPETKYNAHLLRHKLTKADQEYSIIKENFYIQFVHTNEDSKPTELPPFPLPPNTTSLNEALHYFQNLKISVTPSGEIIPHPPHSHVFSDPIAITSVAAILENHKTLSEKIPYDAPTFPRKSISELSENWIQEDLVKSSSTPDDDLNELEPLEIEDLDSFFS